MENLQDMLKADIALLSSYPTISSKDPEAYPWVIETEIQSPSPITFVKSPSHDIAPSYGNEGHTCKIAFKSNTPQYPNKDFILLYTNEDKKDKIDYMLTPFEEGYCAMVNVRADFQTVPNEKVYENLVKAKEVENEYSMDEVRGEYIFLIDRSGSMDGDRITMARDSLVLFLKSLPQESLFNVVSFGDSYEFLFQGSSEKYTQSTLERAVKEVERFEADLGGTEIYDALKDIFNSPLKEGYPRSIFLLTDGAVSNTSQVLKLIQANSHKTKVFTIGIGNGCSQELITQGAACGRGKHEFVANNSEIYEKVISLLNASLSPCYSEISLEGNNFDAVVKALTPNPSSIPLLIDGQTITFFLLLRPEAFANGQKMVLKLNMNDSRSQQRRSIDISLDTNEAIQNDLIPKLAVHDMIRRLETEKTNIVWISKEDIQETLLDLSLKYGILCKETAFFCETEKENVKVTLDTQKIKIVIPTTTSHDYHLSPLPNLTSSANLYSLRPAVNYDAEFSSDLDLCSDLNEVQDIMANNIAAVLQRGEQLESLSYESEDLAFSSKKFKKKAESGGLLKSITNKVSSLFGSKPSNEINSLPRSDLSIAPAQTSNLQDKIRPQAESVYYDEEFTSEALPQRASSFKEFEDFSYTPNALSDSASTKQSATGSSGSYLDIIKKQKFEGFWDSQDSSIHQTILKNGTLPEIPEQIKNINASLAQTIWLTLLVLLWLEVSCQSERKAWLLIYQKGINWLKKNGVNYEETKNLGVSEVKS